MERYFALKISFSETKKFSTESFLTFRELQSLVSYKRVSYKNIPVLTLILLLNLFVHWIQTKLMAVLESQ